MPARANLRMRLADMCVFILYDQICDDHFQIILKVLHVFNSVKLRLVDHYVHY